MIFYCIDSWRYIPLQQIPLRPPIAQEAIGSEDRQHVGRRRMKKIAILLPCRISHNENPTTAYEFTDHRSFHAMPKNMSWNKKYANPMYRYFQ